MYAGYTFRHLGTQFKNSYSGQDVYVIEPTTSTIPFGAVDTRFVDSFLVAKDLILDVIIDMFNHMVVLEDLQPSDRFLLRLDSVSSDHVISIAMQRVDTFNAERILDLIDRMLNSNDTLSPMDFFFVWIFSRPMYGGAYFATALSMKEFIKKKTCITEIRNDDNLCFYRCIALHRAKQTDAGTRQLTGNNTRWARAASSLQRQDPRNRTIVSLDDIQDMEQLFGINIHVICARTLQFLTPVKPAPDPPCFVLYVSPFDGDGIGHYHYVNDQHISALWSKNAFCYQCMSAYISNKKHRCVRTCPTCHNRDCGGLENALKRCPKCSVRCFDETCLNLHLTMDLCIENRLCTDCGLYKVGWEHVCGKRKCKLCQEWLPVGDEHLCSIPSLFDKEHKTRNDEEFIFYDYETYRGPSGEHIVACVVAMYNDSDEAMVFHDHDKFIKWLFRKKHRGYVCLAHNSGKYDMHFIKREMINRNIASHDICNGRSIYFSESTKHKITFLDSHRFIGIALRDFPKTFGIREQTKGYFPYRFLNADTIDYVGKIPLEYYDFQHMRDKENRDALAWYNENKDREWNVRQMMIDYCVSDVRLLKEGCNKFREMYLSMTENRIDPFMCVTIASVCMKIYRTLDLKPGYIAKIYENDDQYEEHTWVDYYLGLYYEHHDDNWVYEPHDPTILLSLERDVEYQYGTISAVIGRQYMFLGVQSSILNDPKKLKILHYLDCQNSGCPKCFHPNTIHPIYLCTNYEMRKQSDVRVNAIQNEYGKILDVVVRGCVWKRHKSEQEEMPTSLYAPLRMRDAFFGGRTEPFKLFYEMQPGEQGRYVDFISLYPSVQSCRHFNINGELVYDFYPMGHPHRMKPPFRPVSEYYGFIKCKIYCPPMYIPLLPVKHEGKLMFPTGMLTGTWTTIEVARALEVGYVMHKIYDILHFPDKTTDLFISYVARFTKYKVEAGKWEKLGMMESSNEEKSQYLQQSYDVWGTQIDPENMNGPINDGILYMAKLSLNSLWGKFGQRQQFTNVVDTFDHETFAKYCHSEKYDIKNIFLHTNQCRTISYDEKEHTRMNTNISSIAVAAWTTAKARLRLFDVMHKLGQDVIYCDTDSVIYIDRGDPNKQIPVGSRLGDLQNEIKKKSDYITKIVSTAPKSYAYVTKEGSSSVKSKGFTLSVFNSERVNIDSMEKMVHGETKEIETESLQFEINRDHQIKTKSSCKKILTMTFDKRKIVATSDHCIDTVPLNMDEINESLS